MDANLLDDVAHVAAAIPNGGGWLAIARTIDGTDLEPMSPAPRRRPLGPPAFLFTVTGSYEKRAAGPG